MGGEGEGSEIRPEEPEPKVVDATESDGDVRPSDPGFDASDGDRDRPGAVSYTHLTLPTICSV